MIKNIIQTLLDNNIPKDVIKTRSQGGTTLSYLETWQVIDRMNQVLGQGNWGYQIARLDKVFEGKIEQYSGEAFTTSYTAQVSLFATIEGKTVIFTEVGYGDGTDKKSPGKAHELATKEAVSDALKRAAKNLGRSMGLALYDKTQEFVGETTKAVGEPVKSTTSIQQPTVVQQSNGSRSVANAETAPTKETKKPTKELITQAFKVLEAQKKITAAEFKTKYQKGAGLSTLSQPTLEFILMSLKTDFPGLGL